MGNRSKIFYDCNQPSQRNDCLSEGPPFESRPNRRFVNISVPPEVYLDNSKK
jgi:hypothetical protein